MPNNVGSIPAIEVTARWDRDSEEYWIQAQNPRRAISIYTGSVRRTSDGEFQTTSRAPRHIVGFLAVPFASLAAAVDFQVRRFGCRTGFWLSVVEPDHGVDPGAIVSRRWIEQGGAS